VHNLGATRSARHSDHFLLTPDTFVRAPLPGMTNCMAVVHAAPSMGAGFTQYTAEFESGGEMGCTSFQRFIYVLEGSINANASGRANKLTRGGFAFLPEGLTHTISAGQSSRVVVIEKKYERMESVQPPQPIVSSDDEIESQPLEDNSDLQVKHLLPEAPALDFAVNIMTYQPGAALSQVEMHIMEHGLLMLEGSGIYRLGDSWYSVTSGDFIWMAPWCPQWFGAIGKVPAKYLIYKNWNRHPLGNAR
jgi:(S)-ureidoglycine aminohydrolase